MLSKGIRNQYFATICANLATLIYGLSIGWLSPNLKLLLSDETPLLTGRINASEAGWIGSIGTIGCVLAVLICGWVAEIAGRKAALMLIGIAQLASWVVVLFAQDLTMIYTFRILGGFAGGGTFSVIPLFVSEISEDKIRGTLGAILSITCNMGILLGFLLCYYLDYFTVVYIALACCIFYSGGCMFLPESPQYLFNKEKKERAIEALRFYRGEAENESSKFISEVARFKEANGNATPKDSKRRVQLHIKDLLNKPTLKGILICVIVMMIHPMSGSVPLITYTESIFRESGSDLSPSTCSIIVAAIGLVGSYVSSVTVDKAGRKVLLVISCLGCAIFSATMGTYKFLSVLGVDLEYFKWIPVTTLSGMVFITAIGIGIVPFIIMPEILEPRVRGFVISWCLLEFHAVAFLVVKYFPTVVERFGLYPIMWFFSCCCIAAVLFVIFYVPETKGKSFEEITESLDSEKKTVPKRTSLDV
ncbi:facilitated trehalose transporter Tret1-like [Uranotaenia lowii]|uniref:facilitated trehalose transporter Tret1-like n=1 Tax=Uranotaenia lowii TaxID=190385 RepID=UPI00247A8B62|nr:facilitated trehalose transporter Tret1-like [Uranotaenia lowii]XP_055595370.1 facilitated trehalose transporter Tret1-like [Uranotaenia lowii]XP_055595371.1 facilitated trehalose transporter Tret1-like [Uranotaenia lowii]XP_055595372.1 facilitated trehalose transporter Tret1-like [Uranotaenia lowii]